MSRTRIKAKSIAVNAITDRELSSLVSQQVSNGGANKNIIINGAMNVAQRSTSVADLGNTNKTAAYLTLDRMYMNVGNTAGRLTMTQDSSGPSGFANSLKLDCTTADASIASNEAVFLQTNFEGQNLQVLKKGTSSAVPVTISFYVKGNASATYVCELYDYDNSRQISQTFNVTADWTRVELTFVGDTTGALGDDNGLSFAINIWLHAGSNSTSGTLSTTWTSVTAANRAVGISSILDSTARTFFITGWQMEIGQNATAFEHEPYDRTLVKCQRYYLEKSNVGGPFRADGYGGGGTTGGFVYDFPVAMRAAPTGTLTIGEALSANNGSAATTISGLNSCTTNPHGADINFTGVGSYTGAGLSFYCNAAGSKTAVHFNSEL